MSKPQPELLGHPRIVMFSGGLGSYAAARIVVAKHGPEAVTLLFADTLMEDEDLYRFQSEAVCSLGAKLVRIADGRTPWQVFFDERYLGNSRVDPCSRVLKRELCDDWLRKNCDPKSTTVYVGIDWTEIHRFERLAPRKLPWVYKAPLCNPPYHSKQTIKEMLLEDGIAPPRLYAMGFAHNNCGGFCIKAGQAHFANLLAKMPDRYAEHERHEQALRAHLGKDVSILKDRRGGDNKRLTLEQFRKRVQNKLSYDKDEWGGCGCYTG